MKKSIFLTFYILLFFQPHLLSEFKEWSEFTCILRPSTIPKAGVGVFATHDIKAGVKLFNQNNWKIARYDTIPEIFTGHVNMVPGSDEYCFRPERFDVIDIRNYLNHSFTPNLILNKRNELVAQRDIKEGEELFIDYSDGDVAESPEEAYYAKPEKQ